MDSGNFRCQPSEASRVNQDLARIKDRPAEQMSCLTPRPLTTPQEIQLFEKDRSEYVYVIDNLDCILRGATQYVQIVSVIAPT